MNLRTCNRCGWVHVGVTRAFAEDAVASFNTYFEAQVPSVREMFGNKHAGISEYERCDRCGGPHTNMREFTAGDCPDGCTIGPIIVELPGGGEVNS